MSEIGLLFQWFQICFIPFLSNEGPGMCTKSLSSETIHNVEPRLIYYLRSCMGCVLGWHLDDSVASISTTRVVSVRKLVLNWLELCVNPSWMRAMSGQNCATGSWIVRRLFVNSSWIRRDDAGGCVQCCEALVFVEVRTNTSSQDVFGTKKANPQPLGPKLKLQKEEPAYSEPI